MARPCCCPPRRSVSPETCRPLRPPLPPFRRTIPPRTSRSPRPTPQSGCTPQWEDGGDSVGAFSSQISALQQAGGDVIISFGGASGGELAQTCTDVSSLEAAYANVVNTYHVTRLDFDIEGGVLD